MTRRGGLTDEGSHLNRRRAAREGSQTFVERGRANVVNANVNLSAPVGVLGFLGACFVLLVLGLVALHALIVRRFGRARVTLALLACVVVVYFGLVLVFSMASGERILARGEEKRSEEHTSELQSRVDLVCRLLLEKKKTYST